MAGIEKYPTWQEASVATIALGIKNPVEYKHRYIEDPRLPSKPGEYYPDYPGGKFFGRDKVLYATWQEASAAALALGIASLKEYDKRRREDPKLPATLNYYKDFPGIKIFLGRVEASVTPYETYSEAETAARKLGIVDDRSYMVLYRHDPRLVTYPQKKFGEEFKGYSSFLGSTLSLKEKGLYETLAEAKEAAGRLEVRTEQEYYERWMLDEKLPGVPYMAYKKEWKGWADFLGGEDWPDEQSCYPTLAEAKESVRRLGIKFKFDYIVGRFQDPRLPESPEKYYESEFQGFSDFFGATRLKVDYYPAYAEAKTAVIVFAFKNARDYRHNARSKDVRLPARPNVYYGGSWRGWDDFLRGGPRHYDYEAARLKVKEMLITTRDEYVRRHHEDALLPSAPHDFYGEQWNGYKDFLYNESDAQFYGTLSEARKAVEKLGISNHQEYRRRYKEDRNLPRDPKAVYADEWVSYKNLFVWVDGKFMSVAESHAAAVALGCRHRKAYSTRYSENQKLHAKPDLVFKDEWDRDGWDWNRYLGVAYYPSVEEAGEAARRLGIYNMSHYQKMYMQDPSLPREPEKFYSKTWVDWDAFFLPQQRCKDMAELKYAVKYLGIKNSVEYRAASKNYRCLPVNPDRVYKDEFVDWYDLCDIPAFYSYEEAQRIVQEAGVTTEEEYRVLRVSRNDPRLPSRPYEAYDEQGWINSYKFFGTTEPYGLKYIHDPYTPWKVEIEEFMRSARGGGNKTYHLCRFVREHVQRLGLAYKPEDFYFSSNQRIEDIQQSCEGLVDVNGYFMALRQFSDYIIKLKFSLSDPDSDDVVTVANVENPFNKVIVEASAPGASLGESNKPALAYHYVSALRNWIAPSTASSFSDLKHLHQFDGADWLEVDESLIDRSDPDCVLKLFNGKWRMWNPINWMFVYALVSAPARGIQYAYNDSGEADKLIPEIDGLGNIIWVENKSPLAGLTHEQGFIKRYANGEIGMHFTTNKTARDGAALDVAWMPLELARWMIRLRNWQAKYNPITRPYPWLNCTRTNLNESQRKRKGSNCFLFREWGEEETGIFSFRLRTRLAAGLYHSQPENIELATCNGNPLSLSSYESDYTSHSMRVSLITAYVIEFGMPIDIVMKIAGHSNLIMTLYYVKINGETLRRKFEEGEKRALADSATFAMAMIEQNRIDKINSELVVNTDGALERFTGKPMPGSVLFRDFGFCPHAGTRCSEGGPRVKKTYTWQVVEAGYLGSQNCIRCRFLVTGPVFLGGLLSLVNEIVLQVTLEFDRIEKFEEKINDIRQQIDDLDMELYQAEKRGEQCDRSKVNQLRLHEHKLCAELEGASKKADVYLCDIQYASRLINQCVALVNSRVESGENDGATQLIVQSGVELKFDPDMCSRFRQLSEVCENAEIFESASAETALAPRSQQIDAMLQRNRMSPGMFALSKEQQLIVGNQVSKFLITRLETWAKVDELMDGRILISDLLEHEGRFKNDLKMIMKGNASALTADDDSILEVDVEE